PHSLPYAAFRSLDRFYDDLRAGAQCDATVAPGATAGPRSVITPSAGAGPRSVIAPSATAGPRSVTVAPNAPCPAAAGCHSPSARADAASHSRGGPHTWPVPTHAAGH